MKKKILVGIYILMVLFCAKLTFNYIYNTVVIYRYHQYDYTVTMKPLLLFNWSQSYIAHYNQGNIYYENYSYEDAILSYKEALSLNPPKEKECAIRINLALAMLGTMGEDYASYENADTSLEILTGARDVLLEEGCATENGDGHSKTAEQLKEEIEAMIRQLEQQSGTETEEEKDINKDNEEQQEEAEDTFEDDVKKALQEKQSKANKERRSSMEYYEELEKDFNFDDNEYIW